MSREAWREVPREVALCPVCGGGLVAMQAALNIVPYWQCATQPDFANLPALEAWIETHPQYVPAYADTHDMTALHQAIDAMRVAVYDWWKTLAPATKGQP